MKYTHMVRKVKITDRGPESPSIQRLVAHWLDLWTEQVEHNQKNRNKGESRKNW